MPAPMTAPMPRVVRFKGPSARLRLESFAPQLAGRQRFLRRNKFMDWVWMLALLCCD